jgi:uncharacterized protein YfkK (UPF0435 family)
MEQANVWQEIKKIRRRLNVLEDAIMSPEDKKALKEAREDLRGGRTIPHEDVLEKTY